MADSHDRYENVRGGGGFMLGLLTGAVLGAGLAMLLAPKAGSELRGAIGDKAKDWGNAASEQYRKASENASSWAERGREFVDKTREAVTRTAEEVRGYATGATGSPGNGGDTRTTGSTGGSDFGHS